MNHKLKSLIITLLLSGAWGVAAFIAGYSVLSYIPLGEGLFYPLLLSGAAAVTAFAGKSGLPVTRAALAGLVSGFVYTLVSPLFPLLAAILAGACLGGGLARPEGRPGGLLDGIVSTLKGILILPLFILSGRFLSALVMFGTHSVVLALVFWGMWLGLAVWAIATPLLNGRKPGSDTAFDRGLDEFRAEAREIERDISEFTSGID